MAFKMKGWSPFDKKEDKTSMYKKEDKTSMYKKIKEEESFTDKEESYMDRVYAEVAKKMGDTGGGYDIGDIIAMTEKERMGNIDDYEKGDFAKMVAEAKKKIKR